MALVKCPRCELNYMQDTDKVCSVCRGEMRNGDLAREDVSDLCIECGENPVAPGEELCYACIKEIKKQENLLLIASDEEASASPPADDDIEIDDMAGKLQEHEFEGDDQDMDELDEDESDVGLDSFEDGISESAEEEFDEPELQEE